MSTSRGKKVVFTCAALAVLAAGTFYINTRMQAAAIGRVQKALSVVPAPHSVRVDAITAGFFGKVVTVRGLQAGIVVGKDTYAVRVGETEVKGLADVPHSGGAVLSLVDTLVLRDVSVSGPDYEEKTAEYRIDDVRADLPLIVAAWKKLPPGTFMDTPEGTPEDPDKEKKQLKAGSEFLVALETLYIGKAWNRDSTVTQPTGSGKLTISEEIGQWLEISMRRIGPSYAKGLRVSLDGKELCSLEQVSMDGLALPSLGTIAADAARADENTSWRDLVKRQSFALKNLAVKGLSTRGADDLVKGLASFSGSFDAAVSGEKALSVSGSWRYEDLVLNKDAVNTLLESNAGIKDVFSDPLQLSGDMAFSLASKDEELIDTLQKSASLRAKGLADIRSTVALEQIPFGFGASWGKLKNASLSVTDYKGSDLVIRLLAEAQGKDPKTGRADIVAALEEQAQALPPALLPIVSSCIEFIKNPGGTLSLSVDPQKPLPLLESMALIILAPEQLGLSASFKAGAK